MLDGMVHLHGVVLNGMAQVKCLVGCIARLDGMV
jgi:hypothetical protein